MRSDLRTRAILTLGSGADGHEAILAAEGLLPLTGRLEPRFVQEALDQAQTLQHFLPPSLSGYAEPAWNGLERRTALLLNGLLHGPQLRELANGLSALSRREEDPQQPLELQLDLLTSSLSSLPWELLEALPPMALLTGRCRVLRSVRVAVPPSTHQGAFVALSMPPPSTSLMGREELDALMQLLGGLPKVKSSTGWRPEPHGSQAGLPVLHLMRREDDHAELDVMTSMPLNGFGLVVLDLRRGLVGSPRSPHELAAQLIRRGAPAVLTTQYPTEEGFASCFFPPFYRHLTEGMPITEALGEGRQALRVLESRHAHERWWSPMLLVAGDGSAALRSRVVQPGPLAGWPSGDAEAEEVLRSAANLSKAQGFLGIEHVAMCLGKLSNPPPPLALLQAEMIELGRELTAFGLNPVETPRLTPRMETLGNQLAPGFDLMALIQRLLAHPGLVDRFPTAVLASLDVLGQSDKGSTFRFEPHELQRRMASLRHAPLLLEVLGGPEDGRQLRLSQEGELLGRWDASAPAPLESRIYLHEPTADRTVSRRHLLYRGGLMVESLATTQLKRNRSTTLLPRGITQLQPGDVLLLGEATRLRVLEPS